MTIPCKYCTDGINLPDYAYCSECNSHYHASCYSKSGLCLLTECSLEGILFPKEIMVGVPQQPRNNNQLSLEKLVDANFPVRTLVYPETKDEDLSIAELPYDVKNIFLKYCDEMFPCQNAIRNEELSTFFNILKIGGFAFLSAYLFTEALDAFTGSGLVYDYGSVLGIWIFLYVGYRESNELLHNNYEQTKNRILSLVEINKKYKKLIQELQ